MTQRPVSLVKQGVCELEIVFEHMAVWIMRSCPTECPRVKLDVVSQLNVLNHVFASLQRDESVKSRKRENTRFLPSGEVRNVIELGLLQYISIGK